MSTLPATAPDALADPGTRSPLRSRLRSLSGQFSPRFWVALVLTLAVLAFAFIGPLLSGIQSPTKIVGGLYASPRPRPGWGQTTSGEMCSRTSCTGRAPRSSLA